MTARERLLHAVDAMTEEEAGAALRTLAEAGGASRSSTPTNPTPGRKIMLAIDNDYAVALVSFDGREHIFTRPRLDAASAADDQHTTCDRPTAPLERAAALRARQTELSDASARVRESRRGALEQRPSRSRPRDVR